MDPELGVNVLEVLPHCHGRDPKALGDLSVCHALGNEIQDLALARREPRQVLLLFEKQGPVNQLDDERAAADIDA